VLVSIPKAEDRAAKEFMVRYHTARSAGARPLDAYRKAQRDMLADDRFQPALWVGMTMYGCC